MKKVSKDLRTTEQNTLSLSRYYLFHLIVKIILEWKYSKILINFCLKKIIKSMFLAYRVMHTRSYKF